MGRGDARVLMPDAPDATYATHGAAAYDSSPKGQKELASSQGAELTSSRSDSDKAWCRKFVRQHANRHELCLRPLCPLAVRADELVFYDGFCIVTDQLGAEPPHLGMAIRTIRCLEVLCSDLETVDH